MNGRFLLGAVVVGWLLAPSGAVASAPPGHSAYPAVCAVQAVQQPAERAAVVDERTGAELRLTARPNGALQVRVTWPDFEFRKVIQPNGDFTLRLAGSQDLAVVVRVGDWLRVTRNGKTAVLSTTQTDEPGLERAQQVVAGSRAMRMFRTLHSRLSEDTLTSAPGMMVDITDVQIGVLQGDSGVLERRRGKPQGRLTRAALGGRERCWDEYESNVTHAWGEFGGCVHDMQWIPGGPEMCAIVWTIQVEGAWFGYLSCCGFPKNE